MKWKALKDKIDQQLHQKIHKAEHVMHAVYLGSVSVFAHGPYAYAAGGLFLIVVISFFIHEV